MMTSTPTVLFFDRRRSVLPEQSVEPDSREKIATGERLCCAVCTAPITSRAHALVRRDRHEHYFTNPHGIGYRIGCFGHAGGLAGLGPETDEFTWFAGYRWKVMLCGQCNTLLGWRFRSPDDEFFGLIVARLLPCAEGGAA